MKYTVDMIKEILRLEIAKMHDFFILEEFIDFFKVSIDNEIKKEKGNYFLNNNEMILINNYMENENERHFNKSKRISFSFAVKEYNKIHCFDISIYGLMLAEYPAYTLKNEEEIPSNFYISDEDTNEVLLFKNGKSKEIVSCDLVHDF